MKVEGSHTFNAPRDVVWPLLLDPDVLANVMPGCEKLEEVGDNQFEGALKVRVGPVQGKFNGKVKLDNINEPESYDMEVDGKGPSGFVKGTGGLRLEAAGDQTQMHYEGDVQVGGRIASVGQRLLDTSAKAIIRQSLEELDRQIEARLAPETAATATAAPQQRRPQPAAPPSQTDFALGVARNFIEEFVPEEQRGSLAAKGAAALGVLLILRLISNWWTNRIARRVVDLLDERR